MIQISAPIATAQRPCGARRGASKARSGLGRGHQASAVRSRHSPRAALALGGGDEPVHDGGAPLQPAASLTRRLLGAGPIVFPGSARQHSPDPVGAENPSLDATCRYLCTSLPRRSRRSGRMIAPGVWECGLRARADRAIGAGGGVDSRSLHHAADHRDRATSRRCYVSSSERASSASQLSTRVRARYGSRKATVRDHAARAVDGDGEVGPLALNALVRGCPIDGGSRHAPPRRALQQYSKRSPVFRETIDLALDQDLASRSHSMIRGTASNPRPSPRSCEAHCLSLT